MVELPDGVYTVIVPLTDLTCQDTYTITAGGALLNNELLGLRSSFQYTAGPCMSGMPTPTTTITSGMRKRDILHSYFVYLNTYLCLCLHIHIYACMMHANMIITRQCHNKS